MLKKFLVGGWWWKVIIVSALSLSLRDKERFRDWEIERAWQYVLINAGEPWRQGVKVGTLGRQNERNSIYVRLTHTSIFGLFFMPVCLMKSNCYSLILIYSSLIVWKKNFFIILAREVWSYQLLRKAKVNLNGKWLKMYSSSSKLPKYK